MDRDRILSMAEYHAAKAHTAEQRDGAANLFRRMTDEELEAIGFPRLKSQAELDRPEPRGLRADEWAFIAICLFLVFGAGFWLGVAL